MDGGEPAPGLGSAEQRAGASVAVDGIPQGAGRAGKVARELGALAEPVEDVEPARLVLAVRPQFEGPAGEASRVAVGVDAAGRLSRREQRRSRPIMLAGGEPVLRDWTRRRASGL